MKAVLAILILLTSPSAFAITESTRETNPNALGVEIFGRGLLYSVFFDRVANNNFGAGVGFGTSPMQHLDGTDAARSSTLIPVYFNYYVSDAGDSLFLTAGMTIISNYNDVSGLQSAFGKVQFSSSPVLPNLGVGYESRGDNGFLVRVAGYGIFAQKFAPWLGATLGYTF